MDKLSRSEFERRVTELTSAGGLPTDDSDRDGLITIRIGHMAKQCFEQPRMKYVRGTVNTLDVLWKGYSEAYLTGFEKIAGYYRFIYAFGDDRSIVN